MSWKICFLTGFLNHPVLIQIAFLLNLGWCYEWIKYKAWNWTTGSHCTFAFSFTAGCNEGQSISCNSEFPASIWLVVPSECWFFLNRVMDFGFSMRNRVSFVLRLSEVGESLQTYLGTVHVGYVLSHWLADSDMWATSFGFFGRRGE